MKCLLCDANFLSQVDLKNHYIWKHSINENNIYLNDLFRHDTIYKGCDICEMDFENSRSKKKHMFLFHFGKTGGNRGNGQLQINVLKRGAITYYTTSFAQHRGFYNFFGEQIVDDFLMSVYNIFVPDKDYMIQGYAQIMKRHSRESSLLLKIPGCG